MLTAAATRVAGNCFQNLCSSRRTSLSPDGRLPLQCLRLRSGLGPRELVRNLQVSCSEKDSRDRTSSWFLPCLPPAHSRALLPPFPALSRMTIQKYLQNAARANENRLCSQLTAEEKNPSQVLDLCFLVSGLISYI